MELFQTRESTKEYIHYIAEAVKEKVAAIIVSKNFMAILSESSQARKTNNEKELVLVKTVCEGIPIYVVVSLLEMCERGGTDADSIKEAIDNVFDDEDGYIPHSVLPPPPL